MPIGGFSILGTDSGLCFRTGLFHALQKGAERRFARSACGRPGACGCRLQQEGFLYRLQIVDNRKSSRAPDEHAKDTFGYRTKSRQTYEGAYGGRRYR